jgi:hypothetical protein
MPEFPDGPRACGRTSGTGKSLGAVDIERELEAMLKVPNYLASTDYRHSHISFTSFQIRA